MQATVSIFYAILAEAGLSFLGLGVKPSTPTWGLNLERCALVLLPRLGATVFPCLAITITVLSVNFLGNALRDMFDVREYDGKRTKLRYGPGYGGGAGRDVGGGAGVDPPGLPSSSSPPSSSFPPEDPPLPW